MWCKLIAKVTNKFLENVSEKERIRQQLRDASEETNHSIKILEKENSKMKFTCGICKKEYDKIEKRNECESACIAKQKKDAEIAKQELAKKQEKERQEQLAKEKDARLSEISRTKEKVEENYKAYLESLKLLREMENDFGKKYNGTKIYNSVSEMINDIFRDAEFFSRM